MSTEKTGFLAQIKSYPSTFWVANTMEIFERMSWYGWFTVMAVYVTGSVETGGLGFSTETRGLLQGIVPFFLYLMPVLTGALADRYGYKKMFILAFLIMIASYYLLGQAQKVPTFFLAFMFVAVGAAIFKPVVVGTVARVTDESNSATAFGIFYMMVNIGGFVGPIVAGIVRGKGWEWVFVACSGWAVLNLLIVLLFYREPTTEATSAQRRTLKKVLDDLVEVLGNLRFFITVGVVLVLLMAGNVLSILGVWWFTWPRCLLACVGWIVLNFLYDAFLWSESEEQAPEQAEFPGFRRPFFLKRMHCSNWRFALFLLIMSGFWTSFNQIFYTMPEYLRDFVQTRPLLHFAETVTFHAGKDDSGETWVARKLATISEEERHVIAESVGSLVAAAQRGTLDEETIRKTCKELRLSKIRLTPEEMRTIVTAVGTTAEEATKAVIHLGRQVNPEYIVNIDAGAIVL
ncbi:MAG: MFS transporter, partial [Planctomycetota bacterium]